MPFSINKMSRSIRLRIWRYNCGANGNPQQQLRFNDKLSDIANRRALHLMSHRQSAFSELPKRHSELAFLNPTLPRFCCCVSTENCHCCATLYRSFPYQFGIGLGHHGQHTSSEKQCNYRQGLFLLTFSQDELVPLCVNQRRRILDPERCLIGFFNGQKPKLLSSLVASSANVYKNIRVRIISILMNGDFNLGELSIFSSRVLH